MDERSPLEDMAGPAQKWNSDPGVAGLGRLETDAVQKGCAFCCGHILGLTDEQKWQIAAGGTGLSVCRREKWHPLMFICKLELT